MVNGMVNAIIQQKGKSLGKKRFDYHPDQVWTKLKEIFSVQLGINVEQITKESDIYEDLPPDM